jgi:phosphoenolpyruvate carboxylase
MTKQLSNKRPMIHPNIWNDDATCGDLFTDDVKEVLDTFSVISKAPKDSLHNYVISQASTASDVLAVLLLQKDAGVVNALPVVPLFETLDDLKNAEDVMKQLWSNQIYKGSINGKQEIMVGYSDSAKDAGRLAACWAQYEVQERLAALAKEEGIELTFFHGKGGTVGRGGNPATFEAILAHPPATINGRFRVTEQGEMINQNFGHPDIAERTLDLYTAALLAEKYQERQPMKQEWRDLMDKMSAISCDAYRKIVREDERFVPYFRAATPELELTNLNIGSRPAKRKVGGGVESLRAIPWIFAWTQTRLNLPTWLGVGEALTEILESDNEEEAELLRDMYENYDAFRTTVDLVEMVLAKSEPEIAKVYEDLLVKGEDALELGREIRETHALTVKAVLSLTGHARLGENNAFLMRSMGVRNPYVDCLNVLQAETLRRLREVESPGGGGIVSGDGQGLEKEKKVLTDALMISINGIASGMKNTG